MGIIQRWRERRAAAGETNANAVNADELLRGMISADAVTPEIAMQIPAYAASVGFISDMIGELPIRLYREDGTQTEEITDDPRLRLLNGYTGDELFNTGAMLRGMIRDYFNRGEGYVYIERGSGWKPRALHYVAAANVSAVCGLDPIRHTADLFVAGARYYSWDFIRITRNSADGAHGIGVPKQAPTQLATAYNSLLYELAINKAGGSRKGILQLNGRADERKMELIKEEWAKMCRSGGNSALVLNSDVKFHDVSASSLDLQINQNKITNSEEIAELFGLSPEILGGRASEDALANAVRIAVMPRISELEDAINDALLTEEEKPTMYFVIDAGELTRGDILKRYQAYAIGLSNNFLQADEVRYREDMAPLGLNFIKLGLNDVLYDPKSGEVYTPNTNQTTKLGETQKPGVEGEENAN